MYEVFCHSKDEHKKLPRFSWGAERGEPKAEPQNHCCRNRSKIMGKGKKTKNKEEKIEVGEDRFAAAETRPHFRSPKQSKSKVVLDDRFSSVLTDPRFQFQEKDKYGRKKKKKEVKDELSAFYTVEEEEDSKKKYDSKKDDNSASGDDSSKSEDPAKDREEESESEDENEDPASRIAYLTALSRGEMGNSSSEDEDESSQSSDDDEDEDGEDPVYGTAGVLDPSNKDEDLEISYESSPYLVVTNMDWEHLRAIDLFSILSSFTPPGAVKRVQVFHSDFGVERMTKDKLSGPSDIWKKNKIKKAATEDEDEAGDDEDSSQSEQSDEEEDGGVRLKIESEDLGDEYDFDPEKLRAYEASKLKYFFAVVEFSNPEHSDIAYREVDGMEFEHSSSAIDLRTLPSEEVDFVVKDRPMRDEATSVPSNYEPPDFIISALQQTKVQCTWDQGDAERERKLTQYSSGGWQEDMTEADDLKAYLASDASSDEDSEDEKANKTSNMRKLLGLSGDEDEESGSESSDVGEDSNEDMAKEITYVPGKKSLEDKIRTKLQSKDEEPEELTPWQKYQEKRKDKRKERRQASRNKKRGIGDDGEESAESDNNDDFFADEEEEKKGKSKGRKAKGEDKGNEKDKNSKHELELLLAGEDDDEEARDYDIRGIQRMEKNEGKKLRGSRKRKEDKLAADVSGKGFKVDLEDNRFAAVLEGSDGRFGIDKTDPNYKDTSAMREVLKEQTRRRKNKRQRSKSEPVAPDVSAETAGKTTGSSALSSLVKRLKSKVSNTAQ
jgi:hypothetical protein